MQRITPATTSAVAVPVAAAAGQAPTLTQQPTRTRQTGGPHLFQRGARVSRHEPLYRAGTTSALSGAHGAHGAHAHSAHLEHWEFHQQMSSHQALIDSLRQAQDGVVDSASRQLEIMKILQR